MFDGYYPNNQIVISITPRRRSSLTAITVPSRFPGSSVDINKCLEIITNKLGNSRPPLEIRFKALFDIIENKINFMRENWFITLTQSTLFLCEIKLNPFVCCSIKINESLKALMHL